MKHDGYNKKTGRPEFCQEDNDPSVIERYFGGAPTMKIWQVLWEWQDLDLTKSDFSNCGGVSRPSLYKVWDMFIDEDIIIPSRKLKGKQLYKLNKAHKLAMKFIGVINDFVWMDVDKTVALEDLKDKRYKKWNKTSLKK
jgi:hypothetical protein